jgi:ppGpp synthetase/RelA/SpoT-type nucleotidyltranferase
VAASSYEEARAAFIKERPTYKELTLRSCALLDEGLKAAGIRAEVTGRAKDVDSFVKKLLSKPEYVSGERPIQDKAGVRIPLPYFGDEPAVEAVIRERFEVDEREATIDRLGVDKLGYLAVHYILRPKVECLSEEERTLFAGLQVEVQVGSLAQRAWAEVSHELLYKPAVDPPPVYKRVINRLMALVEVFDEEVERARDAIAALPGFEETVYGRCRRCSDLRSEAPLMSAWSVPRPDTWVR